MNTLAEMAAIMIPPHPPPQPQPQNLNGLTNDDQVEIDAFRRRFKDLAWVKNEPLYALVPGLLDAIERSSSLRDLLSKQEYQAESELAKLFNAHQAAGFYGGSFVSASLFTTPGFSAEDLAILEEILAPEQRRNLRESLAEGLGAIDQTLARRQAYVGWLLVNPSFLRERDEQRVAYDGVAEGVARGRIIADPAHNQRLIAWLDRWRLSGLWTWDLPIPQGPNLSGVAGPQAITAKTGMATVSVPDTFGTPSDTPVHQILESSMRYQRDEHLKGWYQVIDRKTGSKGLTFYQHVLHVHFYLNLVLGDHYPDRLKGRLQQLDSAFAKWRAVSDETIRKARLHISRALATGR